MEAEDTRNVHPKKRLLQVPGNGTNFPNGYLKDPRGGVSTF